MTASLKSTPARLGLILLVLAAATWWWVASRDPEIVSAKADSRPTVKAGKWDGHDGATRFAAAVTAAQPGDWAQLVREALDSGNEEILREMQTAKP